ncbi:hypothetical protein Hanom_Chr06g00561141 [Helianthus anomalus]
MAAYALYQVIIARKFHFNYTTPDRSRQEMLNMMTPLPTQHWPFVSKEDEKKKVLTLPRTPKAPRHGARPPSRYKLIEMRQVAAVLFQESSFSPKYIVPSVLPNPICKAIPSNRVLFDEELELCQAVAQNKLRYDLMHATYLCRKQLDRLEISFVSVFELCCGQWRSLRFLTGGSKMYVLKNFYKTGGSKTYIPKNFYTKTTYSPLLSEKFRGSAAPSCPHYAVPLVVADTNLICIFILLGTHIYVLKYY